GVFAGHALGLGGENDFAGSDERTESAERLPEKDGFGMAGKMDWLAGTLVLALAVDEEEDESFELFAAVFLGDGNPRQEMMNEERGGENAVERFFGFKEIVDGFKET